MSNIYNKFIKHPNGILIDNWYEEDELRRYTGEGRTIPSYLYSKRSIDPSNPTLTEAHPRDNTFKRVIGEKEPENSYFTHNATYGNYNRRDRHYTRSQLCKKDLDAKFKLFIQTTQSLHNELEEKNEQQQSNNSTYRSSYVAPPLLENIGRKIMFTPDMDKIGPGDLDRGFMAQHHTSKYPESLTKEQTERYVDRYVPYYKDKEITYWSMNLDKGNMYRSFKLGTNPFARSHAFTQPIQKTHGTIQYYANNKHNNECKNVYLDEYDMDFYQKYKNEVEKKEFKVNVSDDIGKKLLTGCAKRGWIGLRELKRFLKSVAKKRGDYLDKNDFKFYLTQYGVELNEYDIGFIFSRFDTKKSNQVPYVEVLNSFRYISDDRMKEIEEFKKQVIVPDKDYISAYEFEKLMDMNIHPEVVALKKTAKDAENEYFVGWEGLRDDDFIMGGDFEEFFKDVSACVESDEDFVGILKACGYKK